MKEKSTSQQTGPKSDLELSDEERQLVKELRARDAEVKAQEQAHLAVAGPYAKGAPTFEFQTGPDGQQYAFGGEVSIDSSPVPGTLKQRFARLRRLNEPLPPATLPRKTGK